MKACDISSCDSMQGASPAVVPATLYLVATSLKLYYVYVVVKLKSSKLVCLSCLQDYSCATLKLSHAIKYSRVVCLNNILCESQP